MPDLLAVLRIVGDGVEGADADDLIPIRGVDRERRRIGLRRGLAAIGPPARLAGAGVERDHEALVEAVAVDDQQIAGELGRAAVAVLRLIRQPGLPEDRPGRRQRGSALGAEVDVDPIAVDNRRRRGVAVLRRSGARNRAAGTLRRRAPVCRSPASKASRRSDVSFFTAVAVVSHTRPPATTGDDHPRPGTGTFHATFFDSLHSSGSPRSVESPCPSRSAELRPVLVAHRRLRRRRALVRWSADPASSARRTPEGSRHGRQSIRPKRAGHCFRPARPPADTISPCSPA